MRYILNLFSLGMRGYFAWSDTIERKDTGLEG